MKNLMVWIADTLLLLLLCLPQSGDPQVLRLQDGRLLVGELIDHDLEGLVFRRAEDGGVLALPWSRLFVGESDRIRSELGYQLDTSVPMVTADRLILVDGTERLGRIVRRDDRLIELRTRNTLVAVPRSRLAAPPDQLQVEAAQILTPDQFYGETVAAVSADDALAQFQYALKLKAMFALEQAGTHFGLARGLAAGDNALLVRIDGAMVQLAQSMENRDQAELLDLAKQAMHRQEFVQAEAHLADFASRFPDSPLEVRYGDLLDRLDRDRERAIERHLARRWYTVASAIIRRRSTDRTATPDEIMSWIESDVPTQVRQQLLEEVQDLDDQIDTSAIDGAWAGRVPAGAKGHQASYGIGSWLLGEERARAGLGSEEEDDDSGKTDAEKQLEERMRRFLENMSRSGSSGSAEEEVAPEDWWRRSSATERYQWMLAYYAEFSGDYEITSVRFEDCHECGGIGTLTQTSLGGNAERPRERRKPCPVCHTVGVRRAVHFR